MTVFGKYGGDIGILAGDALLMHGMSLLNKSSNTIGEAKKPII